MSPVTDPAPSVTPAVTEPAKAGETPAQPAAAAETPALRFTTAQALTALWLLGAAGMALWFVLSNLRFARFLRRSRIPLARPDCPLPVYLVEEGLPSPCLAGLLRPAVYLTPAVAGDARRERHVLAHELTHARHLDPLWSFLRCLCLTVYWFDPLVWIAAHASRSDCELACDEGALRRLGEGERIPYGETLLSLIPVGRPDPMLSATTMTAGKRQLRERIRRIASGHRQAALAVFAVLCAAAILCAATFTGSAADRAFGPDGVLSGSEIQYFNETFFNRDLDEPAGIRSHFLACEYERPEDIDLYQLFYCGVPVAADDTHAEELRLAENGPDASCPTDILPVSAMDEVLRQYTGKGFQDMDMTTLKGFDYPEEGYYTHAHGDTNFATEIQVFAGEREGDTVTLYYTLLWAPSDWHRLTLQEGEDGSYQFRSNLPCEKPAIAPRLPETEPVQKLSLADARAVEPREMPLTRRSSDCQERGGGCRVPSEDGEDYAIHPYRSTDGKIYVAVIRDEGMTSGPDGREITAWEADCFLTVPEPEIIPQTPDSVELDFFRDLFSYSGFTVRYYNEDRDEIQDYYYLAEGGVPYLLLRVNSGWLDQIDLDGDGVDELYNSDGLLYFLRDGTVYEADVKSLLQTAWPDFDYWDWSYLDRNYRHIQLSGLVRMPEWGEYRGEEGQADFCRYLYFDGESLLAYRELQNVSYTDHLASTVSVPGDVAAAAKARTLENYNAMREDGQLTIDDWRVTAVTQEDTIPLADGRSLEIYRVSGCFHTTEPARQRAMAGNIWLDEDGWLSGATGRSPYLVFLADGGKRVLVESDLPDDCSPGSQAVDAAVVELLLKQGYAEITDLDQETLVSYFYFRYYDCLDRIAQLPEADWDGLLNSIRNYYDRSYFKDTMYNLLHSPSGLTEDAARCYRRLLYLENSDESRIPISVELMCDAAIGERYESVRGDADYAAADLSGWQGYGPVRVADYQDFHGLHLQVYRVEYYYECCYPENLPGVIGGKVVGKRLIPSPDGSAYVLFEVKEDLHRVRLGDTDIPGIDPESDPAAFRRALEDYFRTEHPGEIEGLGQDVRTEPGVPLSLWDRGSHQAVEDYLASYIGAFQTSSLQVLDGGWELWTYEKDSSWYLFLVSRDGKYAQLPLPVYDGSLRYAEPTTTYQSGGPVRWEARVPQRVYSAVNGNLAQESGIYRYELDLDTLTLYESFTPTESTARDASFAARSLSTGTCGKTRQELLSWLTAEEPDTWQGRLPTGKYWEHPDGAVAYLAILTGVPHTDQFELCLRFSDGTEAQLPLANIPVGFAVLTPSSAAFTHGSFTYDIDASELGFPGSVYRYTVDLTAKTVAMTVTQV